MNYVILNNTASLPTIYVFLGRKHKLKQKSQTQTELDDMHYIFNLNRWNVWSVIWVRPAEIVTVQIALSEMLKL